MAKKRASGGAAEEARDSELANDEKEGRSSETYNAVGSKTVKEARAGGYGGHNRGGAVGRAAGGAVQALKRGGKVHKGSMPMHVEGGTPRHHRLDRPGRKRGGGIGADMSPMTAAARLTAPSGAKMQTTTDKRDD